MERVFPNDFDNVLRDLNGKPVDFDRLAGRSFEHRDESPLGTCHFEFYGSELEAVKR